MCLRHHLRMEGGADAGGEAQPLDDALERQGVHHRRHHSHVVAGAALDAEAGHLAAAQEVAAADDQGDFYPRRRRVAHLPGDGGDGLLVQPRPRLAPQRLAGKFEHHSLVHGSSLWER